MRGGEIAMRSPKMGWLRATVRPAAAILRSICGLSWSVLETALRPQNRMLPPPEPYRTSLRRPLAGSVRQEKPASVPRLGPVAGMPPWMPAEAMMPSFCCVGP